MYVLGGTVGNNLNRPDFGNILNRPGGLPYEGNILNRPRRFPLHPGNNSIRQYWDTGICVV